MNIQCPSCQTRLKVDPTKYTQIMIVVQCPNCQQKLRVKLPQNEQTPSLPLQAIVIEEAEAGLPHRKPADMFRNPFSFDGRIRRTEYFLSFTIFIISISLINNISDSMDSTVWYFLNDRVENESIKLLLMAPTFISAWFMAAQGAKRCHDLGNSGWFQL